jgi:hypothetical protein
MSARHDVFISYRRNSGSLLADLVTSRLQALGYNAFMDTKSMPSGPFPESIARIVKDSSDFIPILSKNCFAGPRTGKDWFIEEIKLAMRHSKNIVPVRVEHFSSNLERLPLSTKALVKELLLYETVTYLPSNSEITITNVIRLLKTRKRSPRNLQSRSVKLRLRYSGKLYVFDFKLNVLFDGKIIGSGSAIRGFSIDIETTPGKHNVLILQHKNLFGDMERQFRDLMEWDKPLPVVFSTAGSYEIHMDHTRANKVWVIQKIARIS